MTTTEAAAILEGGNEMTTAEFFLTLRDETTVWCSEHNAAVSTWQTGPAFADRTEAEEFIANSREWYDSKSGPDHCLFRHDDD